MREPRTKDKLEGRYKAAAVRHVDRARVLLDEAPEADERPLPHCLVRVHSEQEERGEGLAEQVEVRLIEDSHEALAR